MHSKLVSLLEGLATATPERLAEMFNSYSPPFGEVPEEVYEETEELGIEILNALEVADGPEALARSKAAVQAVVQEAIEQYGPLETGEKAYIVNQVFHHCNENYYEFADDGSIEDERELQEAHIQVVTEVLQEL